MSNLGPFDEISVLKYSKTSSAVAFTCSLVSSSIDFAKYATNFYYVNFDEHKQTYGVDGLPEVVNCVVNEVSASNFVYAKTWNKDSYDVDLTITYEDKEGMPTDDLMTDFTVTLLLENDGL